MKDFDDIKIHGTTIKKSDNNVLLNLFWQVLKITIQVLVILLESAINHNSVYCNHDINPRY
jgi:hypothetical protein